MKSHVGPSPGDGAIDALLDDARSAVDPFLAVTLYERALHTRPNDTSIMGEAAELMLQVGDTATAKEVHTQRMNTTYLKASARGLNCNTWMKIDERMNG